MTIKTQDSLKRDLDALDDRGFDIPAFLKQLGIKGQQRNTEMCPVARYLQLRGYVGVSVHSYIAYKWDDTVWKEGTRNEPQWKVTIPLRVSNFIIAFDNLRYPEMVETTE